ncbi:MAG: metal ABC transporter permease [Nitrospirota bacterium]
MEIVGFLNFAFVQKSLLVSVLVGLICSLIGVFVILRGLSFMSVGIANAAFAGVVLGFILNLNPIACGLIVSLCTALLIGHISRRAELKLDASIGIFFAFTMAIGFFLMGLLPEKVEELRHYLFGTLILPSDFEIKLLIITTIIVIIAILLFFKEFYFITYNQDLAEASGLPATFLFYFLLCLVAITIVSSLKAVGELLVVAMIIIPAASACQLTYNIRKALGLSTIFGVISAFLGVWLSFYLNIKMGLTVPTGAVMVIIATLIFFLTVSLSPKRGKGGYL